ncbi:hypothetical protein BpHYR1_045561 [Brachionus plicatilis]|uniref:Uncharacterized protein n=1 Tax=Brachionus plicatilis TaxID=10195 RepID=A0A3M7QM96_BRAPC|nr:hypothetical protein BpHYR1_045561 [Brachionus plicatilis]
MLKCRGEFSVLKYFITSNVLFDHFDHQKLIINFKFPIQIPLKLGNLIEKSRDDQNIEKFLSHIGITTGRLLPKNTIGLIIWTRIKTDLGEDELREAVLS